ncbi:MAG: 30S ribosomal protein S6 [Ignavibacteriae bacterium HGW-Ignavibacteriae-2]|jgi:small subunit ribosomal protein S6|nr:30S ribosomal protein S6 [Bacteroidota bacterium]PKL89803.1 MAG: 30S ribosomal protein S6 [Ignavibacteriae bacterium HGW-Ignavibacteriae-2]
MKNNHYESVVIINAALEDEHIDSNISRIEEFIKSHNGEIIDIDKWGRKRLAYPISKSKSGYYVIFRFISTRDLIAQLERTYRLDESIIRYLTIVLEPKALEFIAKQALQKKEEEAEKAEIAAQASEEQTTKSTKENTE